METFQTFDGAVSISLLNACKVVFWPKVLSSNGARKHDYPKSQKKPLENRQLTSHPTIIILATIILFFSGISRVDRNAANTVALGYKQRRHLKNALLKRTASTCEMRDDCVS